MMFDYEIKSREERQDELFSELNRAISVKTKALAATTNDVCAVLYNMASNTAKSNVWASAKRQGKESALLEARYYAQLCKMQAAEFERMAKEYENETKN